MALSRIPAGSVLYSPAGAGSVPIDLASQLQQQVCVLDFIPKAERAAILAGTSTYDATDAVAKAIAQAGGTKRLVWRGVVNTRALASTASVDWLFERGAEIKWIPGTYNEQYHVSLTGPNVRLEGFRSNGNQYGSVAGQGTNGLLINGASPTVLNARIYGYNGRGYDCNSVNLGLRRGVHINCDFSDNVGLGMMTSAAAFNDWFGCSFDRNGYGFQKVRNGYGDASHDFIAFGIACRYRSHHLNFVGCWARDNGRDGFNVNQGSYAIRFTGCYAMGNDDGGFTVAADNTGTGLPGESEACYDISYDGCEGWNNYTGGLVVYQAAHGIHVNGGRFYNNHRLAGNIPVASSYFNGIFIAGGSTGVDINTTCFDDRQVRAITAVSGGVLTATGWIAGTMSSYPKVAVWSGTNRSFKGYGKITAESAGSVTIAPTTYNGVTLASIAVGDYVGQAVQHNGTFVDNSCNGRITVEGAGYSLGAQGFTGRRIIAGCYASGQNIVLPAERLSTYEMLANPSFDVDMTGWAFNIPGGGSNALHTGAYARSASSLQFVAGTGGSQADSALVAGALKSALNEFIEAGFWVYSDKANSAYITLFWSVQDVPPFNTTVVHPGGGWKYLRVGAFIPGNTIGLFLRLGLNPNGTAWFDSGKMRAVETATDMREIAFPSRTLPY